MVTKQYFCKRRYRLLLKKEKFIFVAKITHLETCMSGFVTGFSWKLLKLVLTAKLAKL